MAAEPAAAAPAAGKASYGPNTFGARAKLKDCILDSVWMTEANKRHNKGAALYECYQINPYTHNVLDFTARKPNERKPKEDPKSVEGYACIKENISKPYVLPYNKKCHPETETQRFGWFPGFNGFSNYDERFTFAHRTVEFIKTDAAIRAYDKIMKDLTAATRKEAAGTTNV